MFAYCNNNPVMYLDRTGTFAISMLIVGAVGALLGAATVAYVETQFHPIENMSREIGQVLSWLGTQAWNGLQWLFSQWEPGTWPGDDPTIAPGDGFIWRGPGDVGSDRGEWYNPITGDKLHPNLFHPYPKGPHWGWRNKLRRIFQDIFKNGGPPTLA